MNETVRRRLDELERGMSEAKGAPVKLVTVPSYGKPRSFHEIRMAERKLRAALDRIVNRPNDAETIARDALYNNPA